MIKFETDPQQRIQLGTNRVITAYKVYYELMDWQNLPELRDVNSDIVNLCYDLQFWHYNYDYKKLNTFQQRIDTMESFFGTPSLVQKNIKGHGLTHIWICYIDETPYYLFLTNLTFFIETIKTNTNLPKTMKDLKKLERLILKEARKNAKK